ncbi:MAG TPA: N-acetyltransferase [Candidatus Angelobacter sp.]|nr:N-acetyltransferase [Candidatus Angelobacter sp.]
MAKLRAYREQDFTKLLAVDEICFVPGIAYTEEELRHFLTQPTAIALVGEKAGKIEGFVIADRFRARGAGRWMGHIITLDVLPEAQRHGLGTKLLTRAEEELKTAGCDHVALEVAEDNSPAIGFYKKHGYTVLKILPRYYLDSIDGLLMGKRL